MTIVQFPTVHELEIDRNAMAVYVDGREVEITVARFRVLSLLWECRGAVVSHERIANASHGEDWGNWYARELSMIRSRNIIWYLRRTLGDAVKITHRRGVGYRLDV